MASAILTKREKEIFDLLVLNKSTKGFFVDKMLRTSYIKDIPNLTNEGNLIVLDCASYNKGKNDAPKYKAYQYTLSHHLFSHIVALYYKCEDKYIKGIQWFLNQEFNCYESMMRKQLGTTIPIEEVKDSPFEEVNETIFSLEDFMDANDKTGRWTESRKAIATFKNGEEKRIDGDVLVVDGEKLVRKSIFSLADINFDNKDITIIYYQNPENFAARITFDEPLSRRFYAGADVFLMPSEFEPCGLAQMIAMRYGTLPLVRETGGLKDTVSGYWDAGEDADGFSFKDFDANGLLAAVDLALDLWFEHHDIWDKLQQNAFDKNFGWEESAEKYRQLYDTLF